MLYDNLLKNGLLSVITFRKNLNFTQIKLKTVVKICIKFLVNISLKLFKPNKTIVKLIANSDKIDSVPMLYIAVNHGKKRNKIRK